MGIAAYGGETPTPKAEGASNQSPRAAKQAASEYSNPETTYLLAAWWLFERLYINAERYRIAIR